MINSYFLVEKNERNVNNNRELVLWEWFDIYGIMNDFFQVMENPVIVNVP